MSKKVYPDMINLDSIIGQEQMHLKLLFDKLIDVIMIKWQKKKEIDGFFDYGGAKLENVLTKVCNFIDALGDAFSENYERILKVEKTYEIMELQELMLKWADNRESDAIVELVNILNLKTCKECEALCPSRAKYCPKCGGSITKIERK